MTYMTLQQAVTFILETADIKTRDDLARRGGNKFLYAKVRVLIHYTKSETLFQSNIRAYAQTKIQGYKHFKN